MEYKRPRPRRMAEREGGLAGSNQKGSGIHKWAYIKMLECSSAVQTRSDHLDNDVWVLGWRFFKGKAYVPMCGVKIPKRNDGCVE